MTVYNFNILYKLNGIIFLNLGITYCGAVASDYPEGL